MVLLGNKAIDSDFLTASYRFFNPHELFSVEAWPSGQTMTVKDKQESGTLAQFGIDEDDVKILELLQANPDLSYNDVASLIHKSQPAVGARVMKLRRKGLLVTKNGANFKDLKDKLYLVMVDLQTRNPDVALNAEMNQCPFVVNIFKKNGPRNICVLLAASNLEKVESIIDRHFRSNPDVLSVESSVVVNITRDLVLPINWDYMKYEDIACGDICCRKVRRSAPAPVLNDEAIEIDSNQDPKDSDLQSPGLD